ncbi:MFS general substrate transporter-25 [Coleophoma cylindrospora]|uniref:MFS general substrate transporter-25 n=1 Tax=Coleophoma cylindrospora TaxID=1849047 RepID=A0A3D8QKX0_9HELO|nr:MFS general substrate transporter-25 [Coleophoma cylindrospora]
MGSSEVLDVNPPNSTANNEGGNPCLVTPVVEETKTGTAVRDQDERGGIGPPPDGGFIAWLQVFGSFFLFFNSWGIMNTFGVFQTYYESALPNSSPSAISWIGSLQAFLLRFIGVITGPLYDIGYFRTLIATGTFLVVFGTMMTSLGTQYWHFLLAQGFCVGLGAGCVYMPCVSVIPQYFTTKRGLATGVAATGSSFGGVLYPIIFRNLESSIGFGWAVRVMAFVSLATCSISFSLMRLRHHPSLSPKGRPAISSPSTNTAVTKKQTRSLLEPAAFKEPPYVFFCAAIFLGCISFFIPIFYIQSYAQSGSSSSHSISPHLATYLLAILNASSIVGRLGSGVLDRYAGPVNMLTLTSILTGTLSLCWIAIPPSTAGGLVTFAVFYGIFSGGFISLPAVAVTSLTTDMSRLGTRMGMNSAIGGFGSLCGSPIAGAILNGSGGWVGLKIFAGVTMLGTGLLMGATKVAKVGWKPWVKA